MSGFIGDIFQIREQRDDFSKMDQIISTESEKQLQKFKKKLSLEEYEEMRDVVFSLSQYSKKLAFEVGFKTGMQLILECKDSD